MCLLFARLHPLYFPASLSTRWLRDPRSQLDPTLPWECAPCLRMRSFSSSPSP